MMHHRLSFVALLGLLLSSSTASSATATRGVISEFIIPMAQSYDSSIQLQSTQEELVFVESQFETTQEQLSHTETVLESTRDVLQTTESRLETTIAELETAQEQLSQTESLLESTRTAFSATESILESTSDVLETTVSRLDATLTEMESLQDQLSQCDSVIDEASDRLYDPAVPEASAIDATIANLFSFTPYDGINPTSPLLDQINNGLISYLQAALAKLGEINRIAKIAVGYYHTLVLTENGAVYSCGRNNYGQLGIDNIFTQTVLTPMVGEGSSGVIDIAVGALHSVVLKNDGSVYACGRSGFGQLGIGLSSVTRITLSQMIDAGTANCSAIAAGQYHTVVLKNDGSVWATGYNANGQLGIGNTTQKTSLTPMAGAGASECLSIAAGFQHTVVLKNDGSVWATGFNQNGQLGIGNLSSDRYTLTPMAGAGATNCSAVSGGQYHTVVLKNDGSVWATGGNFSGQLGIGNTTQKTSLTMMAGAGASGCSAVSAHFADFSVVLKNDGSVWATGTNNNGQLGIGTPGGTQTSLVQMVGAGIEGCSAIANGFELSVVLKNDGSIWATGDNSYGQLGIGAITNRATLTKMSGFSNTFFIGN